jgi:hypothetical protein
MAQTNFFPMPDLGDIFVRKNLNGLQEKAMILSVMFNAKSTALWQATMQTKNGIEFITGDREHRNEHDWRPHGWVFDELNNNWYSVEDMAKMTAKRAEEAAEAVTKEPAHKDDFIVADAAAIPNALTAKRKASALPKAELPSLPQV